jgi:predicted SAM-dependent methyltransferase
MLEKNQFGSKFYNLTLRKYVKFEIISYLKRLFGKKNILTKKKYIQLGCTINDLKKDFINLDFDNKRNILFSDFRYRLPFKSDTFFGAFSEHSIEHLNSFDSIQFLSEVYRILIPDGVFRIIVPNLNLYIKFYEKKISNAYFKKFMNGCEAIWMVTQNQGHQTVWDYEMLQLQLKKVGFKKDFKRKYKVGTNADLLLDKKGRQTHSLYVEAIK